MFWKHLHRVGVPFGESAWDHARAQAPGGTEEQIADAAAALLGRAHNGPDEERARPSNRSRRGRRVAARNRATATDRPVSDPPAIEPAPDDEADSDLAKVIPRGPFDPLADPWRRP
ncbi:hypothetical protein [Embleya scabrispora]|uniref:hypothetical protein n=1 Tax=Embleya scabrispora TaxID=159449 RepID=UPI001F38C6EC|nr:hypothetical protein [Embleya scabrispora]